MRTFTKRRDAAPEGFFAAEAAGLRWLAVPGGAPVVDVVDVTADSITISRVDQARPTPEAAFVFGRQLAVTHDAGAVCFGSPPEGWSGDGFIGAAGLSLRGHDTWGEFYAAERVLPYANLAHQRGALSSAGLDTITDVAQRLAAGAFDDDAPPARIHGDLWAGNVLFTTSSATLIDPAAHGGHRLTDLAMLALFGLAHLKQVLTGYAQASRWLPHGWPQLIGLHQLHPLLVHAVLFGGGFGEQAVATARRYGSGARRKPGQRGPGSSGSSQIS